MTRNALLYLSKRAWLRRWLETSLLARSLTSRFIAGETLDDALRVFRNLDAQRIFITLDYLGENVTTPAEAEACRDAYLRAFDGLTSCGARGDQATVSLKLTHFGLDISERACRANLEPVLERARAFDSRVEVDMESSYYTDRTIELISKLHARGAPVRAVIQAYLYRSAADITRLCREKVPVRLCKGAYNEPGGVAFPKKTDVDLNYVRLMKQLLDEGTYSAIATHDEAIVQETLNHVRAHGYGPERFEFQMLYGIRRDLQNSLVQKGYRLRLYVPYGRAWYPYFMRRLAERPANMLFLARNLFRG
jgi:proline dehydrogenase